MASHIPHSHRFMSVAIHKPRNEDLPTGNPVSDALNYYRIKHMKPGTRLQSNILEVYQDIYGESPPDTLDFMMLAGQATIGSYQPSDNENVYEDDIFDEEYYRIINFWKKYVELEKKAAARGARKTRKNKKNKKSRLNKKNKTNKKNKKRRSDKSK
jgi:hypothetical protein